ncbi:metal-dependent hydrolase [bacterium]|nr:metal-dependent hydrolase [bacterium]
MKGLTHFTMGVALGSFFPEAIQLSQESYSFVMLLTGAFGILPDTLDFKFARYFEKPDYIVEPDPKTLDPKPIAETVAEAIDKAAETGKQVRVRFHTLQEDFDKWRRYSVNFIPGANEVDVNIGPIVSTGQAPYPGTEPEVNNEAKVKTNANIIHKHGRATKIDIMSGPTIGFEKEDDGVNVVFLPWHRQWSHSFTLGILLGVIGGVLFGPLIGLLIGLPFILHVAVDLAGFMGGNLLYPFTRKRSEGFKLVSASSPLANFFLIWGSVLVVLYNLNRFASRPVFEMNPILFFLLFWGIPLAVTLFLRTRIKKLSEPQADILMEGFKEELSEGGQ